MHFYALVVAPGDDPVEEAVERAMAPHCETWDEESEEHRGHWDWYQIGGRWSSALEPSYNPEKDIDNIEVCSLCGGSGTRPDASRFDQGWRDWSGGCNGCMGRGVRVKWPTEWKQVPGNVGTGQRVLDLDKIPYALVTPDGQFHVKEAWAGGEFIEDPNWDSYVRELLTTHANDRVVVVDYHS